MIAKNLAKLRAKLKKDKPKFKRQEWFKHKKLEDVWRRPKGRHSKLRVRKKGRGKRPSIGYRNPATIRGLTASGYKLIRICNVKDLEKIDPEKEKAITASSVGKKKRLEILKRAEELGVQISERRI